MSHRGARAGPSDAASMAMQHQTDPRQNGQRTHVQHACSHALARHRNDNAPKSSHRFCAWLCSIWSFVIDMSDHLHSSLVGTCWILRAERRTYAMPSYIINLFHILSEILKDKYFISIRAENLLANFKVSYTGNTLIWISLIMPNV